MAIVSPDTTRYHGSPIIDFARAVLSVSSGSRASQLRLILVLVRPTSPTFCTAASNAAREGMFQTTIWVSSTMPTRAAASGVSSSSEPPIWAYGRMLPTLKAWGDPSVAAQLDDVADLGADRLSGELVDGDRAGVDLGGDVATDHAADGSLWEHQQRHRDQIAVGRGVHEGATPQEALHAHRRRATRRRRGSGLLGGSERRLDDELVDLLDVEDHGDVVEPAVDTIGGGAGRGAGVDAGGERRRASDRRDEEGRDPREMATARARRESGPGAGADMT